MKQIALVLLALVCSSLISCGPTNVGVRAGLSFGINEVQEPYMVSGSQVSQKVEVVEESHTPAVTLGVMLRQRVTDMIFVGIEPTVRINNGYTTLFKVANDNNPPQLAEIDREHTSIDIPVMAGVLFEGTTFDFTVAAGLGVTRSISSLQTTFGFSEINGERVSRSRNGISNEGSSDMSDLFAMGIVGFEKQITPFFTLGFDLRYTTSFSTIYSRPGEVYEPNNGSSEHYYYKSPYQAFGISVGASMRL